MNNNTIILIILCMLPIKAQANPVLLWGASIEKKPALPAVSLQEFERIIDGLVENHMIVTFVERQQLTLRNFSATGIDNPNFVQYIKNRNDTTFFMNVEKPLEALTNDGMKSNNSFKILINPLKCNVGFKHIIDASMIKDHASSEHQDEIFGNLVEALSNCPVVYAYTSKVNATLYIKPKKHNLKSRSVELQNRNLSYITDDNFAMVWTKLYIYTNQQRTEIDFLEDDIEVSKFETKLSLLSTDNRTMNMNFVRDRDYYILTKLDIDKKKYIIDDVYMPSGLSYACSKLVGREKSSSNYFEWHDFQVQFFKDATTSQKYYFSEAWNCKGFFTVGILSGLIMTAIILSITFCGFAWIMDINNVDRFDDPLGPTISIPVDDAF